MTTKLTEQCLVLLDVGNGMLSRLSLLSRALSSPGGRHHSLQNPEWSKIRKALEKKFPDADVSSIREVTGFESFEGSAGSIVDDLDSVYKTFLDVQEFTSAALSLLRSLPCLIMELNLFTTPGITRHFCQLLTVYIKIHLFWSSIEERKVLLALHACAYSCVHGHTDKGYALLANVFEEYIDPLKRAVEEFKDDSFVGTLADALAQLGPVISQAFDVDMLRQKNVLNPLEEGDAMPLPVVTTIEVVGVEKECSPLLHCELCNVSDYCTWVIYSVLVCPTLLNRDDIMSIFKMVASDCLVVPLYRDETINVHTALEKLAINFPPKNWSGAPVPKTLKLKQLMR